MEGGPALAALPGVMWAGSERSGLTKPDALGLSTRNPEATLSLSSFPVVDRMTAPDTIPPVLGAAHAETPRTMTDGAGFALESLPFGPGLLDGRAEQPGQGGREWAGPPQQSEGLQPLGLNTGEGEWRPDDGRLLTGSAVQGGSAIQGRATPVHAGLPATAAEQVAAVVEAMAQGRPSTGKVSVFLDPDELGRIGITVERKTDGTTTVHVQAERLATLDMLRADQSVLLRALDQPEHKEGHALSFSWGGEGGQPEWGGAAWGSMGEHPNQPGTSSAHGRDPYAGDRSSLTFRAASRGGIDVTA